MLAGAPDGVAHVDFTAFDDADSSVRLVDVTGYEKCQYRFRSLLIKGE